MQRYNKYSIYARKKRKIHFFKKNDENLRARLHNSKKSCIFAADFEILCIMKILSTRYLVFVFTLSMSLFGTMVVRAQSMDEIKRNKSYIWGQGVGETLQAADDNAVKDLVSQISVNVDNSIETNIRNEQADGTATSSVSTSGNLRVSSSVSLSNCKRIVSEEGTYFVVLRYVAREEIDKMFDARRAKIGDLVRAGDRAESHNKVGDALRNYYWALKMTISIPEEQRSRMMAQEGMLLTTELRERIESILDSVKISVAKIEKGEDGNSVELQFMYKGSPVTSCDYHYFDGYDWINAAVKDGVAAMEMPADTKNMLLRVEYEYRPLWKSDPMVNAILEQLPSRLPYPSAEKRISLTETKAVAPTPVKNSKAVAKEMSVDSLTNCDKKVVFNQADIVAPLIKAMETRSYDAVRNLCSDNGWKWFEKLIKYGNARIVERNDLQLTAFANGFLVRGIKAAFSFKKNNKTFVEDLVFYIKDDKIEGINFGLEQSALEDILRHSMWDANSRLVLINFLENYKTAYALERLDYLNAVFSEDALIIVGNKIPQSRASEVTAADQESYEHNKLTKSQYMKQLERVFAKQEYVNIQFEDATVKKTNRTSERYEIIIKQNYYSATYADKGYLYLLADISNPELPVIHVRVWDENRNNLMNYGEWIF